MDKLIVIQSDICNGISIIMGNFRILTSRNFFLPTKLSLNQKK